LPLASCSNVPAGNADTSKFNLVKVGIVACGSGSEGRAANDSSWQKALPESSTPAKSESESLEKSIEHLSKLVPLRRAPFGCNRSQKVSSQLSISIPPRRPTGCQPLPGVQP